MNKHEQVANEQSQDTPRKAYAAPHIEHYGRLTDVVLTGTSGNTAEGQANETFYIPLSQVIPQ